jgi:biopolymer transport protein ExbD
MAKIKIQKKDIWIDMTPMSDVMTLLLCFFMLTSTFLTPEPVSVNAPNSVSELKIPEQDVLNILVTPAGKVYCGTENKNNMQAMLDIMMSKFDMKLSTEQIKHFREDAMVGAPLNVLSDYLSKPDKMAERIQTLGLPLDSIENKDGSKGKSEFQEWVTAAREANPDIRLAIKCDSKTPYGTIKKLMSELQDMSENRFQLITNLDVKRLNE